MEENILRENRNYSCKDKYATKLSLCGRKINPVCSVHLGVCLTLLVFEFVTPGLFSHKSQKKRLFSSTYCFRPWKTLEAKKQKVLLRTEGKMQSTKHNKLSYFLIFPQQKKTKHKWIFQYIILPHSISEAQCFLLIFPAFVSMNNLPKGIY